jgi:hypothetical protein
LRKDARYHSPQIQLHVKNNVLKSYAALV